MNDQEINNCRDFFQEFVHYFIKHFLKYLEESKDDNVKLSDLLNDLKYINTIPNATLKYINTIPNADFENRRENSKYHRLIYLSKSSNDNNHYISVGIQKKELRVHLFSSPLNESEHSEQLNRLPGYDAEHTPKNCVVLFQDRILSLSTLKFDVEIAEWFTKNVIDLYRIYNEQEPFYCFE